MSTTCRDNLPERDKTGHHRNLHDLLETKTSIHDTRNKVKIDRPHRIGIKRQGIASPVRLQ